MVYKKIKLFSALLFIPLLDNANILSRLFDQRARTSSRMSVVPSFTFLDTNGLS